MVAGSQLTPNIKLIDPKTGLLTAEGFRFFQAIAEATSGGGTFQPLNVILTGLSGMGTGTGLVAQTAAASFLKRTLLASSPILIANPDGVAGNPTFTGDIASNAEAIAGTDTTKIIVSSALAAVIAAAGGSYQPLDADLTSWAGVTRAAGFDTFTATPSSANLKTLVTDETGSGGALVFATGPTLNGPIVQTNAVDLQVGQITFPAAQNASANANTLDDYEEGTFTPSFGTTGVAFTTVGYSSQQGYYEKIGRMVRFFGQMTVNSLTVGAASGNLVINGMPFSNAVFGAPIYLGFISGFTTNTPIHGALSGTSINLYHRTAITTGAVVSTFAVLSATSDIYFGGVYHV